MQGTAGVRPRVNNEGGDRRGRAGEGYGGGRGLYIHVRRLDDYARCADTTAHGAQHLRDILIHSCNCGIGAFARTLLAPEELNEFALSAHLLASDIPSDFPGQASGTLDAEDDLTWSAIGQSTDLLTPISLCAFYAAIANQGVWIAPHLLTETEPVGECIIARSTAQYLVDAMTPVAANAGIASAAPPARLEAQSWMMRLRTAGSLSA